MFDLAPCRIDGKTEAEKLDTLYALAKSAVLAPLVEEQLALEGKLDHDSLPAGYTYFGQFLTHDLTFLVARESPKSALPEAPPTPPASWANMRTPRLDLDSVYGGGPRVSPELYSVYDPAKLLTGGKIPEHGVAPEFAGDDLSRNHQGRAVIGDSRNDENPMVSQMHLAFVRAHNALVDVHRKLDPKCDAFSEARRTLRRHYQWVVLNDFLPRLLCEDAKRNSEEWLKAKRKSNARITLPHFEPGDSPTLPVEFAHAAMRFGHSLVRSKYLLNGNLAPIALTPNNWFAPSHTYLSLFRPLPDGWTVDWQLFFAANYQRYPMLPALPTKYRNSQTPSFTPQMARKLDDQLTSRLDVMRHEPGGDVRDHSLAFMSLRAGLQSRLPSGQDVARHIGATVLDPKQHTPLWLYILREGKATGGKTLGEVGSCICLEVLFGLIDADDTSYLREAPDWKPDLVLKGEKFEVLDLLMMGTVEPTLGSSSVDRVTKPKTPNAGPVPIEESKKPTSATPPPKSPKRKRST